MDNECQQPLLCFVVAGTRQSIDFPDQRVIVENKGHLVAWNYHQLRHDGQAALEKAMERPGFKEAWDAGADEYAALRSLLEARRQAGLTQEEIAVRMGTTKSAVSRLESSLRDPKHSPIFETIRRYAKACGKRVELQLV